MATLQQELITVMCRLPALSQPASMPAGTRCGIGFWSRPRSLGADAVVLGRRMSVVSLIGDPVFQSTMGNAVSGATSSGFLP